MVTDIELRIVLPRRVGDPERCGYDLLTKAGDDVQAARDRFRDLPAGHAALVHGNSYAVHRLVWPFEVQEGGVLARQSPIQLMAYHGRASYLAEAARGRLVRTSFPGGQACAAYGRDARHACARRAKPARPPRLTTLHDAEYGRVTHSANGEMPSDPRGAYFG